MPERPASVPEKIRLALALQNAARRHSAGALQLSGAATRLLEEAEPQAWMDWQRLQSAEGRICGFEQQADPAHDGRLYADTLEH